MTVAWTIRSQMIVAWTSVSQPDDCSVDLYESDDCDHVILRTTQTSEVTLCGCRLAGDCNDG